MCLTEKQKAKEWLIYIRLKRLTRWLRKLEWCTNGPSLGLCLIHQEVGKVKITPRAQQRLVSEVKKQPYVTVVNIKRWTNRMSVAGHREGSCCLLKRPLLHAWSLWKRTMTLHSGIDKMVCGLMKLSLSYLERKHNTASGINRVLHIIDCHQFSQLKSVIWQHRD